MARMNAVRKAELKFIALVLILVFLIALSMYFHFKGIQLGNPAEIKELKYTPLEFIALYVAISFVPIPFSPIYFIPALLYPLPIAISYTLLGNAIFNTLIFFISRYLGRDYFNYIIREKKKLIKFQGKFEKKAFTNILMMRLFFIIPSEFVSIFCAVSKTKFSTYFLSSIIGNIPLVLFSSILIRSVIVDNIPWVIFSIICLIICLTVPFFAVKAIRRYIRNNFFD